MTGQEKHTRLTLDEMIRRSEQVKEAKNKNKTKELYVESLDGTITITKPTRNQFPQVVFYIPVFWLLLSWALAKESRIRTAGFLILLLVLGMGTALEVWLNPGFVSLLVSHCPF